MPKSSANAPFGVRPFQPLEMFSVFQKYREGALHFWGFPSSEHQISDRMKDESNQRRSGHLRE